MYKWTQATFFFRLKLGVFFSNDLNFFCCSSEHTTLGKLSGESFLPPTSRTDNLLCPVYIFCSSVQAGIFSYVWDPLAIVISDTLVLPTRLSWFQISQCQRSLIVTKMGRHRFASFERKTMRNMPYLEFRW